jgi:cytochrome c biogenesis protein ResB
MVKRDRFSWLAMLGAAIVMAGLVMAFYLRKR